MIFLRTDTQPQTFVLALMQAIEALGRAQLPIPPSCVAHFKGTHLVVGTYVLEKNAGAAGEVADQVQQQRSGSLILYEVSSDNSLCVQRATLFQKR